MIAEWEKPWHLAVMELDIQVQRRVRAGRSFTDDEVMLLAIVARDEECGPESVRAVARCIERGVIDLAAGVTQCRG